MKCNTQFFVQLIVHHVTQAYLITLPTRRNAPLIAYAARHQTLLQTPYKSCSYGNVDIPEERDTVSAFIGSNSCPGVIMAATVRPRNGKAQKKSQGTYCFLESFAAIGHILELLNQHPLWNSRGENHFIVVNPVDSSENLQATLETMWRWQALNSVLVFVRRGVLRIATRNPFTNETSFLQLDGKRPLFPDKLANMHGYRLKVAFFEVDPLIRRKGGAWVGRDYDRLRLFAALLNATFEIVANTPSNFPGARRQMEAGLVDMCFNSFFILSDSPLVEFSYPHQRNDFTAILPYLDTGSRRQLLAVFHPNVWWSMAVTVLVLALFLKLNRKGFAASLLKVFGCLLGCSYDRFSRNTEKVRVTVFTFIVGMIIIRTVGQSALISTYVSPKVRSKLTTAEDLITSKLKVIAPVNLHYFNISYDPGFKDLFILSENKLRYKLWHQHNNSVGYLYKKMQAVALVRNEAQTEYRDQFYLFDEAIIPGYDVYLLQKHSPYVDKLNRFISWIVQYRLDYNSERTTHYSVQKQGNIAFSMRHLGPTFYFFGLELAACIACFLLELYYYYY